MNEVNKSDFSKTAASHAATAIAACLPLGVGFCAMILEGIWWGASITGAALYIIAASSVSALGRFKPNDN
jgi:hypothetical protein